MLTFPFTGPLLLRASPFVAAWVSLHLLLYYYHTLFTMDGILLRGYWIWHRLVPVTVLFPINICAWVVTILVRAGVGRSMLTLARRFRPLLLHLRTNA